MGGFAFSVPANVSKAHAHLNYSERITKQEQAFPVQVKCHAMSRQPKVATYARVSTDGQSPDAQLRDVREYVRNRGWEQVAEFIDIGESGSKDGRGNAM